MKGHVVYWVLVSMLHPSMAHVIGENTNRQNSSESPARQSELVRENFISLLLLRSFFSSVLPVLAPSPFSSFWYSSRSEVPKQDDEINQPKPTVYFPVWSGLTRRTEAESVVHESTARAHHYLLQLELEGSPSCSACVISREWALTAAHCLYDGTTHTRLPNNALTLRAGTTLRNTGGSVHGVARSIVHGEYDNSGAAFEYDIALLQVVEPFLFGDRVKPVSLPEKGHPHVTDGTKMALSGWTDTSGEPCNTLQDLEVQSVNQKICRGFYSVAITSNMICAGRGARDTWQGDTGGPLVQDQLLVGIVPFRQSECNTSEQTGVYTRVSEFRGWIKMNSGV